VPHLSGSILAARQPAAGQPSVEVEHDLVLSALDHQEAYLIGLSHWLLWVLGVTDIAFVRAEGVNVSPEQRQRGIESALAEVASPQGRVKNGTWSDRLGVLKAKIGRAEVTYRRSKRWRPGRSPASPVDLKPILSSTRHENLLSGRHSAMILQCGNTCVK